MEEYNKPNKKLRIEDVVQVLTEDNNYEIVEQCEEHIILANTNIKELGQHCIRLELNKYNPNELSTSIGQFPEEKDNENHLPKIKEFLSTVLEDLASLYE